MQERWVSPKPASRVLLTHPTRGLHHWCLGHEFSWQELTSSLTLATVPSPRDLLVGPRDPTELTAADSCACCTRLSFLGVCWVGHGGQLQTGAERLAGNESGGRTLPGGRLQEGAHHPVGWGMCTCRRQREGCSHSAQSPGLSRTDSLITHCDVIRMCSQLRRLELGIITAAQGPRAPGRRRPHEPCAVWPARH